MYFTNQNNTHVNLEKMSYFIERSGLLRLAGYAAPVTVADEPALLEALAKLSASKSRHVVRVDDKGRVIHINCDNILFYKSSKHGMIISFDGQTCQIVSLQAQYKFLSVVNKESANVGRSRTRNSSQRSADDGGSGDTNAE